MPFLGDARRSFERFSAFSISGMPLCGDPGA
jgi:hypothetical protein